MHAVLVGDTGVIKDALSNLSANVPNSAASANDNSDGYMSKDEDCNLTPGYLLPRM
jgi:hypothetical protein